MGRRRRSVPRLPPRGRRRAALVGPGVAPAAATRRSTIVLVGHGYGHGIGMGQWGSLGYALGADGGAGNFTYQQILDPLLRQHDTRDPGHRAGAGLHARRQRHRGHDREQRRRPDRHRRLGHA